MSSATISGHACAEHDVGATFHRTGRLATAESFEELIPDLDDEGVAIDVEHNGQEIGQVIDAEIDSTGRLAVVGVIPDADWLIGYNGDVFLSPELLVIGEGVRTRAVSIASHAALVGLSLTVSPATVGATPIRIIAGDMRRSPDRWHWPMSWRSDHPLLARAVDRLPANGFEAERHRARRIHRDATPGASPVAHGWVDPDGRPLSHAVGASLANHPAIAVR